MSPRTVYRSAAPAVLAVWEANQEAYSEYAKKCQSWMAAFPEYQLLERRGTSGIRASGLSGLRRPSDEWRKDRDGWVPTKARGKRNDHLVAKWAATVAEFQPLPGMPRDAWPMLYGTSTGNGEEDAHHYRPGMKRIGEHVYVTWGCDAVHVLNVDETLWERVKLSVYYAVIEAEEAAS